MEVVDVERVTIPAGDHSKTGTRASALTRFCASIAGIRVTVGQGKEWPRSDMPSKSIPAVKLTLKDDACMDTHGRTNTGISDTLSRTSSGIAETSSNFPTLQARLSGREHMTPSFLGDRSNPHFNVSFELFLYGSDGECSKMPPHAKCLQNAIPVALVWDDSPRLSYALARLHACPV